MTHSVLPVLIVDDEQNFQYSRRWGAEIAEGQVAFSAQDAQIGTAERRRSTDHHSQHHDKPVQEILLFGPVSSATINRLTLDNRDYLHPKHWPDSPQLVITSPLPRSILGDAALLHRLWQSEGPHGYGGSGRALVTPIWTLGLIFPPLTAVLLAASVRLLLHTTRNLSPAYKVLQATLGIAVQQPPH
ncbi:unnamed protein product [Protopolystoma xenopodis]|uniref:Uncharacterized protein n=1 Tax=Protopolystoma xenopodis TaxID=117903 RepID=A0A448WIA1_9PLAT|nr:unnamed protein product [Protopolystoma xenopodis]